MQTVYLQGLPFICYDQTTETAEQSLFLFKPLLSRSFYNKGCGPLLSFTTQE